MIIREAAEDDVTAIANLHAESWRSAYRGILSDAYLDSRVHGDRLADWQRKFLPINRKSMFVLLAASGAELAGFACVFPEEDATFGSLLDNLHVAPQLTGRGIGRQLMSESARRLIANGSRSGLYLWVLEKNEKALGFYEKAGGAFIGSASSTASDGGTIISLRYYWPDLKSLLL